MFIVFHLLVSCMVMTKAIEAALPLENGWNFIDKLDVDPTNSYQAGCLRDDEFKFAAFKGTTNNLVIEFEGGGACWDEASCDGGRCSNVRMSDRFTPTYMFKIGFTNHNNNANPIKDYSHVYIPYCTCDLLIGTAKYKDKYNFNGAANTDLVLDWAKNNYKESFGKDAMPRKVFVTGCSAGSYAALFNLIKVVEAFPTSKIYFTSDSAMGTFNTDFVAESLANWGANGFDKVKDRSVPSLIKSFLDKETVARVAPYGLAAPLFKELAQKLPETKFLFMNYDKDTVQLAFRSASYAGREKRGSYIEDLQEQFKIMHKNSTNVRNWIFDGSGHCFITQGVGYYQTFIEGGIFGGTSIAEGIGKMLNDECIPDFSAVEGFDESLRETCSSATLPPTVSNSPTMNPLASFTTILSLSTTFLFFTLH